MMLEFEGAAPTADEVAAIVAVIEAATLPQESAQPGLPAWRLAALLPDLTVDELRSLAKTNRYVP